MYNSYEFGNKIRLLRKKKGFTVVRLAMELNIYYSYLSKIERGEKVPSIDIAISLANYFGIGIDNEYPEKPSEQSILCHEILNKINAHDSTECKFIYKSLLQILSVTD